MCAGRTCFFFIFEGKKTNITTSPFVFSYNLQQKGVDNCNRHFGRKFNNVLATISERSGSLSYEVHRGKPQKSSTLKESIQKKVSFIAQVIVVNLQELLESLKGSPVGLKLNIELNNFFLNFFRYHIDLWVTFLGKNVCLFNTNAFKLSFCFSFL